MFKFTNASADLYIQLKGANAGQPLRKKIPNSIGIITDQEVLLPDFLYYTLLSLFSSGAFRPYLKGSVVPYIRISDITKVLINHWYK